MARRWTIYLPMMVAAAVLGACAVALFAFSEKAEATFPGKNGRIAFVSTRDTKTESGDIYTMNPNGTAVHRLTNNPELDFEPAWSPGGSKIAFASYRHSNEDIYTINADGTGLERLTHDPKDDDAPAFSPDGNKIAFQSNRAGKDDIYTMTPNGTRVERSPTIQSPTFSLTGLRMGAR
jgi:Tol biopolymer transport system component